MKTLSPCICTRSPPSLSYLDHVIEAGLFGTHPIVLDADVRRRGDEWEVDRLGGTIGRSAMTGRATIRKGERTRIDADAHFTQLDFDDLSDVHGQAKSAATKAGDRPACAARHAHQPLAHGADRRRHPLPRRPAAVQRRIRLPLAAWNDPARSPGHDDRECRGGDGDGPDDGDAARRQPAGHAPAHH